MRDIIRIARESSTTELEQSSSHRIVDLRSIGLPGNTSTLHLAMMMASPDVVQVLLKAGADPYVTSQYSHFSHSLTILSNHVTGTTQIK